jgi:hypothetical protein
MDVQRGAVLEMARGGYTDEVAAAASVPSLLHDELLWDELINLHPANRHDNFSRGIPIAQAAAGGDVDRLRWLLKRRGASDIVNLRGNYGGMML